MQAMNPPMQCGHIWTHGTRESAKMVKLGRNRGEIEEREGAGKLKKKGGESVNIIKIGEFKGEIEEKLRIFHAITASWLYTHRQ